MNLVAHWHYFFGLDVLLGMLLWPLAARPMLRWLFAPKRPINEFYGRILPHHLDEEWKIVSVLGVANKLVTVKWAGNDDEIKIKIADNELMLSGREFDRVRNYGRAIYLNIKKREAEASHAKALETMDEAEIVE
jgi:hypothetical protein